MNSITDVALRTPQRGVPTMEARPSETPARAYYRAHAGKLMVVESKTGRELSSGDFFHLQEVGTHPTGLLVTGLFDHDRRNHMAAAAVRDATPDEIAWHDNSGL
jgi:hypothetical protein